MKATIEFEDSLYRRLKVEAARRGRTIRDMVEEGVRHVLGHPSPRPSEEPEEEPEWFGALHGYAHNAADDHDLEAVRRSIAKGRADTPE
ncbi:MAG: hypothetical protein KY453_05865 [Gemmatimonadetes bacterium]|nr:hypothetical protein [Gemmatimonadota bacterium]